MLVLPALGMPPRYYAPLADALAGAGLDTTVLALRGHGDGSPQASRRHDFGLRELLDEDIPTAIRHLRAEAPHRPLLLMGHSLGGHLAAITTGRMPEQIDGIVLAACGSPWIGAYDGATARRLRLLCALIPPLTALLGYYPGHRLGFGGREARRLMRDWLALARSNRYTAAGLNEDLDAGIARYSGPVLSLRMTDDSFAPQAAVDAVLQKFSGTTPQLRALDATTLGTAADHFRWVRQPGAVIACVDQWLEGKPQAEALRA